MDVIDRLDGRAALAAVLRQRMLASDSGVAGIRTLRPLRPVACPMRQRSATRSELAHTHP
jgi:hypothetical protein